MMDNPILILCKNTELKTNKMRLPKKVIEKMGRKYYMKIYEDKIVLIPIKKEA